MAWLTFSLADYWHLLFKDLYHLDKVILRLFSSVSSAFGCSGLAGIEPLAPCSLCWWIYSYTVAYTSLPPVGTCGTCYSGGLSSSNWCSLVMCLRWSHFYCWWKVPTSYGCSYIFGSRPSVGRDKYRMLTEAIQEGLGCSVAALNSLALDWQDRAHNVL